MDELNLNAFKDYKSPFTKPECKGRDLHRRYPDISKNDACPFHGTSAEATLFRSWRDYREEFAKEENEELREMWLEEMLSYVTATNPPDKRSPLPKPKVIKTKTWYDIDGRPHEKEIKKTELTTKDIVILVMLSAAIVCVIVASHGFIL